MTQDFNFKAAAQEVGQIAYDEGRRVALAKVERQLPWGRKFPSTEPYSAVIEELVESVGYQVAHTGRGKTPWEAYRAAFTKMCDYVPHIKEKAKNPEGKERKSRQLRDLEAGQLLASFGLDER